MNKDITRPELDTLLAIYRHIQAQDYSPTLREVMAVTGASSLSVVSHRINRLVMKGILRKENGLSRSLCLLAPAYSILDKHGYLFDEPQWPERAGQDVAGQVAWLQAEVKRLRRVLVQIGDAR